MLKEQITKEETEKLAEQLSAHMELASFEAGLELQKKGFVFNAQVESDHHLTAQVQQIEPAPQVCKVELSLKEPKASRCSCGEGGRCLHTAAVFFYLYSNYGHPDRFVRSLNQPDEPAVSGQAVQAASRHSSAPTMKLDPLYPEAELQELAAEPERWQSFFEEQYIRCTKQKSLHPFPDNPFFYGAYEQLIQKGQWWRPDQTRAFRLHATLFILEQIAQLLSQHPFEQVLRPSKKPIDQYFLDQALRTARLIAGSRPSNPGAFVPYAPATIELLRRYILRPTQASIPWMKLYRELWSELLNQPQWVEQEIDFLDSKLNDSSNLINTKMADRYRLARLHFDLLREQDDSAFAQFKQMAAPAFEDMTDYLDRFVHRSEWQRLEEWLTRLAQTVVHSSNQAFHSYHNYWKKLSDQSKDSKYTEAWERLMLRMLPRSFTMYSDALIKRQHYRQWVNLQLMYGLSPSEVSPIELKTIENSEPALLLPVYFQAIEKEIARKNRTSYKTAVRWIKKVRQLCTRASDKQQAAGSKAPTRPNYIFDHYIEELRLRYARLRALMEELQKGNFEV